MLLLDSHITLWVLDNNPRLGREARNMISTASRVHVSAATIWELTIKDMLGKLTIPTNLSAHITKHGLSLLSVTADDIEGIRDHPELIRHDPFDRLLVAQATRAKMPLLTADRVLLGLGCESVIDARV